jgi:hypothetical protein
LPVEFGRTNLPTLGNQFLVNPKYHHRHAASRTIDGGGESYAANTSGAARNQVHDALFFFAAAIGFLENKIRRRSYIFAHG